MSDENRTPEQPAAPSDTPQGNGTRRTARWLGIVLVLSLALNLLFVGFAATRAWKHHHGRFDRGGGVGLILREGRHFIKDLPRERRHELYELFRSHRDEYRADRREVNDAVRAFAEVLAADDFDRVRLEAAVVDVRSRLDGLVSHSADATVDILMQLTDAERRDFAQRLIDRLDRYRERDRDAEE